MLLWTQVILGSLSLAIGILDDVGHIQPWHIYSFTFLSAAVGVHESRWRTSVIQTSW